MKQGLQFDFEWLASGTIDASERAGLAALSILVNGRSATELEDVFAKTVRGAARVSAHDLAIWLAANWWRLRWEPQRDSLSWKMSHQIGAVGGGYAWPDLSFFSDGDFVLIVGRPSSDWNGAPLALLSDADSAGNYPLAAGFREEAAQGSLKVMLTKRSLTGRRFELTRLIGDDLAAQTTENLLPVTHAKTARQKFQRAFAQEILCPFAALDAFFGGEIPDDDKMEDAAAHFQVSPLLVETTLVNHGRLPRFGLAQV